MLRLAPGSDLWPVTWAADGNLYASWGDGGGFGGTNSVGRVSLGVARIAGPPSNFTTSNIWGGVNTEHPAQFSGKAVGLLSMDGVLYAWLNWQNGTNGLAWSDNLGGAWTIASWTFDDNEFAVATFLNFSKDYANSRDNYINIYRIKPPYPRTDVYLARVDKTQTDKNRYEFFPDLMRGTHGDHGPLLNITKIGATIPADGPPITSRQKPRIG